MMPATNDLNGYIAELEARLETAEETLRAIRNGDVDALVVAGPDGDRIYALDGAEHSYRVLVEHMREGTLTLDRDGLILYCNQQFADLVQAPLETVIGRPIHIFLTKESDRLLRALLGTAGAAHRRAELNLISATGEVPAVVSISNLNGSHLCAVVTDLTEQKRNEAMSKEGRLSRLILEQAAEAIVVIDRDGIVSRASEAAHRLAGRNVLLQGFGEMFALHPVDASCAELLGGTVDVDRLLATVQENASLMAVEVTLARGAQAPVSLLLSAGALRGSEGDLIGCVVTLVDISARKASEVALARQAALLELSNRDLRDFAYSASHDLREPLRVISLYSQLVAERMAGQADGETTKLFDEVLTAANRMGLLLRDLLSYVNAAEDVSHHAMTADARQALDKAIAGLRALIAEQDARIVVGELPQLRMHEVHLVQLFQNLISNALKYRSEAPPEVRIQAERDRDMWKFSVTDNGIGIARDYRTHIFGLFKRLHAPASYSGSGIGLAICHRIVQRYGGRIWVESEPGAGSTFLFTVPLERAEMLTEDQ